ncbi:hypothetical protein D9611_009373 [Ephemerocybe angulata]|uniref:NYN domain-containing protein n=1 Tax=Ephemerocybe angulata TaxID=980116 RepID=A0A8H5F476_9AGAR|nr:hypothetical protein D9611_009373 [Tulosesus angulatus]
MPASKKSVEKAPPAPAPKPPRRIRTFIYWDFELKEGESLEIVNQHVDAIWGYAKSAKKSTRFCVCSADWNTLAPELRKGLKKSGVRIFSPRVEDVMMGDEALWSNLKEHGQETTTVVVKKDESHPIIDKITSLGSNLLWISSLGRGKLTESSHRPMTVGAAGQGNSKSNLNACHRQAAVPREDARHSGPVAIDAAENAGSSPAVSVFWDYSGCPIPRTLGQPGRTVATILDRIKSSIGVYGHNPQFYAYVHPAQDGSYPKKLHTAFSAARVETRLLQPRAKYRTHQQIMRDVAAHPKEHPDTKTIVLIARESTVNEFSALITLFQQLGLNVVCITTLPTGAEGQEITAVVHSPSKGGPKVASGPPTAGRSTIPSPQETRSHRPDGLVALDGHEEPEGQVASEEPPSSLPETQVPETQVDTGDLEEPHSPFYDVDDLDEPEDTLFFPASSDVDLPSDTPSDLSYPVDDIPIALLGDAAESPPEELPVDCDYPSRSATPRATTPTQEPSDKGPSTDEEWDMGLSDLDNWEERWTSEARSDASESDIGTVDAVEVSGWACLLGKRKNPLDEDCSLVDMSRMRLRKKKRLTVF